MTSTNVNLTKELEGVQVFPTLQQTQNICITTSSPLIQHCTNVVQMFCVFWVCDLYSIADAQRWR